MDLNTKPTYKENSIEIRESVLTNNATSNFITNFRNLERTFVTYTKTDLNSFKLT